MSLYFPKVSTVRLVEEGIRNITEMPMKSKMQLQFPAVFYKSSGPSKLNQLLQPPASLEKGNTHTLTFRGKEQRHHFMQQMPYTGSVAITEGTN